MSSINVRVLTMKLVAICVLWGCSTTLLATADLSEALMKQAEAQQAFVARLYHVKVPVMASLARGYADEVMKPTGSNLARASIRQVEAALVLDAAAGILAFLALFGQAAYTPVKRRDSKRRQDDSDAGLPTAEALPSTSHGNSND
ncbi:hypothetical protein QE400_000135 [Xanthomonas sacchari]|uniref:hypothetical protein n=1 Tax=Xanthomonas sacchari TaxID=56458 RepID=UPI00278ABF4D|nr:hypothetical protein [Xanthomonas sacchari]MDQ1090722.1 hypothetical protein [Xanthomonas sacchari]